MYASTAPQRPARELRVYSDNVGLEEQKSHDFERTASAPLFLSQRRTENAQSDHGKSEKIMGTSTSTIHKSNAHEASVKGTSHHRIESAKLQAANRKQSSASGVAHSEGKSAPEEPKTFYTTKVAPVLRVWKRICPFVNAYKLGKFVYNKIKQQIVNYRDKRNKFE